MDSALERQVGGGHYKDFAIQPIQFAMANNLNPIQHSVIKYVVRNKGGIEKRLEDLDKAIHFIEIWKQMLIEAENVKV